MRTLAVVVLLAVAGAGCQVPGQEASASAVQPQLDRALAYLEGLRDGDGLWPAGVVPLVVEAAVAAGIDPWAWPEPVPVAQQVAPPPASAGYMASLRPSLAEAQVAAARGDTARLAAVQDRVLAGLQDGQFGDPALLNDDAFALLVLGHAQVTWTSDLVAVAERLVANRSSDGGWSWAVGGAGETDMTGMVLAGVAEAGAIQRVERPGVVAFLATTKGEGGGYALQPGGQPNCDSTVWALRARERLGLPADGAAWDFLLGLQGDDGGFAYLPGGASNTLCTSEATVLLGMAVQHHVQVPAGAG